jgi:broad specificity phosphatase PhoE
MVYRFKIHDKPCDTGSSITVIQKEFPGFDFSTVDPVLPDRSPPAGKPHALNRTAVLQRAQHNLDKLYCRHEKLIIVVSHSAFLRLPVSSAQYANVNWRIFDFEHRKNDGDAF